MFSALAKDMSTQRAVGTTGGVWVAKAETLLGPYDIAGAQQLTTSDHYVGRLITDRLTGEIKFRAFRHDGDDGTFVGEIDDPQIAHWDGNELRLSPIEGADRPATGRRVTSRVDRDRVPG